MEDRIGVEYMLIVKRDRFWAGRARAHGKDNNRGGTSPPRTVATLDGEAMGIEERCLPIKNINVIALKPAPDRVCLVLDHRGFITQEILHPHAMLLHCALNAWERTLLQASDEEDRFAERFAR
jgi:hypothetical protein